MGVGGERHDGEKEDDFFPDAEWCLAPKSPPRQYDSCPGHSKFYKYGVYGGLTNTLGLILKGALHAFEEGVCFTLDQTGPAKYAPMAYREEPEESLKNFLGQYFAPMGRAIDCRPKVSRTSTSPCRRGGATKRTSSTGCRRGLLWRYTSIRTRGQSFRTSGEVPRNLRCHRRLLGP